MGLTCANKVTSAEKNVGAALLRSSADSDCSAYFQLANVILKNHRYLILPTLANSVNLGMRGQRGVERERDASVSLPMIAPRKGGRRTIMRQQNADV